MTHRGYTAAAPSTWLRHADVTSSASRLVMTFPECTAPTGNSPTAAKDSLRPKLPTQKGTQ